MGLFYYPPEIVKIVTNPIFTFIVQFTASIHIQSSWSGMWKLINKGAGYILNPFLMLIQGNFIRYFMGILQESLDIQPEIFACHFVASILVMNFDLNKPEIKKLTGLLTIVFDYTGVVYFMEKGYAWKGYPAAYFCVMMAYVITPFFYNYFCVYALKKEFIGIYIRWNTLFKRFIYMSVQVLFFLFLVMNHFHYTYHVILGFSVFNYIDGNYLHIVDSLFKKLKIE